MTVPRSDVGRKQRTAISAAIVAIVLAATAQATSAFPLFPLPLEYFPEEPVGLLQADLNGDGHLDLVASSLATDEVGVLFGNGDGTFSDETRYSVGTGPTFLAFGDFDGDEVDDLALVNVFGSDVSVLLGNENGSFDPEVRYGDPGGGQARFVTVGEFNGDGRQDLLVAQFGGNVLLPGNGDGTFGDEIPVAGATETLAAGDFNGDDLDDLAVPGSVLLSNGDFSFTTSDSFPAGPDPKHIVAADVSGDGLLDLVTADLGFVHLSVRPGIGDGTFGAEATYPTFWARHVVAHDIDRDGIVDLAGMSDFGTASLFFGTGGGQFEPMITVESGGSSVYSMALADFDHDGRTDIARPGRTEIVVAFGAGDREFVTGRTESTGGFTVSLAVADFNGDGREDLAATSDPSEVSIHLADGAGTFEVSTRYPVALFPRSLVATDLTGDEIPDLAVMGRGAPTVTILAGDGAGSFASVNSLAAGTQPYAVESDDLDGDGNNDLLVSDEGSDRVIVFLGAGDGTFTPTFPSLVGSTPRGLALGDLDGDTRPDLVVANSGDNNVSVLLGNGNGTFTAAASVPAIHSPTDVALGDLDGDEILDLAIANNGSEQVQLLLGNGDGSFSPRIVLLDETGAEFVVLADVDGDDRTDLIVSKLEALSVYRGNGDGALGAVQRYRSGGNPVFADFDLDRRVDVAIPNPGATILLNQSGPDMFSVLGDRETLEWPAVLGAHSYRVYKGLLTDLSDVDDDGVADGGYGVCVSASDDDLSDTYFVDPELPWPAGTGFFYLRSVLDAGGEHSLGTTSSGSERTPQTPCP